MDERHIHAAIEAERLSLADLLDDPGTGGLTGTRSPVLVAPCGGAVHR